MKFFIPSLIELNSIPHKRKKKDKIKCNLRRCYLSTKFNGSS